MGPSLFILTILSMMIASFGVKMNVVHQWKYIDFDWESQEQKENAIKTNIYDPHTIFLVDTDKADDGRVFVTVPKMFSPDTPATLATVTDKIGPGGPLLRPYPHWGWHNTTCSGFINIYRVQIYCNHIFILDSGKIGNDQVCDPKLLIFNLKNDSLIETIHIPHNIAKNEADSGFMVMPAIYVSEGCTRLLDKMIIFMTDMKGNGLVVYNASTKRMCRVESDHMIPTHASFTIANHNFTYEGGILAETVVGDELYYAPFSGKKIYKIKIKALVECPSKENADKQTKVAIKLSNQIGPMATVEHVVFYSDIRESSILGTNVFDESVTNTVVLAQDFEKLQAVSGMKYSPFWNKLVYLSDRFQYFLLYKKRKNLDEIYFRYFETDLTEIREKTNVFSRTT